MDRKEARRILKLFSEVEGISGHEIEVAKLVKKELEPYCDKIEFDGLGSIICTKFGPKDGPVVMLCGHMDEVGFLVKKIEKTGHIRLQNVGGWYNHVLMSEPFNITTKSGKKYFGVTCANPPHGLSLEQRSKVLELKDFYLDIGVKDSKMVEELGIRVGDPITPVTKFRVMNDDKTLLGKAFDDRSGLAIAIETMKELANTKLNCTLVVVGTVQEEVGLRGAGTSASKINPDIAFATDVTFSYDMPTMEDYPSKFGSGPALSLMDSSIIAHRGLFDFVENIAKVNKIPYCYDMLASGGTDSGAIHLRNSGCPALTISLPCRYFHSHNSMIYEDDFLNSVELMKKVISSIDKKTVNELKESKYN